jgi:hypothetical protein
MHNFLRLQNKSTGIVVEEIYHAHYTANLIEDEIRKIRKMDYPFRKKYDILKYGNTSESD